jgi:N-methylhydantoinase A
VSELSYKIGIDVGGTFTDLFLWGSDGAVATFKTLSTPADPAVGVLDGLVRIAEAQGSSLADFAARVRTIVHGTTVTTNATLTRRGVKVGLLTTQGVRDALEMRRGIRESRYDNHMPNAVPLVPRPLRRPIAERLDYRGEVLTPIKPEDVEAEVETLRAAGVEAVAICFLNAFANPAHERAAAELVAARMPNTFLSVSTDVLPTIRFYDRCSTTVLNAYIGPVLKRYLGSLTTRLKEAGFVGVLLIMQSSGGVASPAATLERPAMTLLSGPAAGPAAALSFAQPHGKDSCLVVDMGGTSFDASLTRDGRVALQASGDIDRLRVALPMLDIVTIGAGGGSLGWIDAGGLLRMGPQSAGAKPGPACYGRGGDRPTCTDADLVLGYLEPGYFAGGKMELEPELARRAIEEHVAKPLDLTVEQAAAGMYRVINSNMAHGVREITIKRGLDPREFPMVVAGGAGGLHACMIAEELEIPTILVPATASILCATGMLMSDLQHDFARSCVAQLHELEPSKLQALVGEMVAEGDALLQGEQVPSEQIEHRVALDLRYVKQYHEVSVPVSREAITSGDMASVAEAFHAEHDRLYGYQLREDGTPLELITVRVQSVGRTDKPSHPRRARGDVDPGPALKGQRRAYLPSIEEFRDIDVYDGHSLKAGAVIDGPALVERTDTTLFVSARYIATVDDLGSYLLQRRGGEA